MPDLAELNLVINSGGVTLANSQLIQLINVSQNVTSATDRLTQSTVRQAQAYQSAGSQFQSIIRLVGELAAVYGTLQTIRVAMDQAATEDRLIKGFTNLTGSVEEANATLDKLKGFTENSQFEFTNVADSARSFMALGLSADNAVRSVEAIGKALEATGSGATTINSITTAFDRMLETGQANLYIFRTLAAQGIPAVQMLSQALGTDIPKTLALLKEGAISGATAVSVLTAGMEKLAATAKDQVPTFTQLWGSIENVARIGLGSALDEFAKGLGAKSGLEAFRDQLKQGMNVLVDVADILTGLPPKFPAVALAAQKVVDVLKVVGTVAGAILAIDFAGWVAGITSLALGLLAPVSVLFATSGGLLLTGALAGAAAIAVATGHLDDLTNSGESAKKTFTDLFTLWKEGFITPSDISASVGEGFTLAAQSVKTFVQQAIEQLSYWATQTKNYALLVGRSIGDGVLSAWISVQAFFEKFGQGFLLAYNEGNTYLEIFWQHIKDGFVDVFTFVAQQAQNMVNGIIKGITSLSDAIARVPGASKLGLVGNLNIQPVDFTSSLRGTQAAQADKLAALQQDLKNESDKYDRNLATINTDRDQQLSRVGNDALQLADEQKRLTEIQTQLESVKETILTNQVFGTQTSNATYQQRNDLTSQLQTQRTVVDNLTEAGPSRQEMIAAETTRHAQAMGDIAVEQQATIDSVNKAQAARVNAGVEQVNAGAFQTAPADALAQSMANVAKIASDFATSMKDAKDAAATTQIPEQALEQIQKNIRDVQESTNFVGLPPDIQDEQKKIQSLKDTLTKYNQQDSTQGKDLIDQYTKALDRARGLKELETTARGVGDAFANAFDEFISGAKTASAAAYDLVKALEQLIIKKLVLEPLSNAITSGITGIFGGLFGGVAAGGSGAAGAAAPTVSGIASGVAGAAGVANGAVFTNNYANGGTFISSPRTTAVWSASNRGGVSAFAAGDAFTSSRYNYSPTETVYEGSHSTLMGTTVRQYAAGDEFRFAMNQARAFAAGDMFGPTASNQTTNQSSVASAIQSNIASNSMNMRAFHAGSAFTAGGDTRTEQKTIRYAQGDTFNSASRSGDQTSPTEHKMMTDAQRYAQGGHFTNSVVTQPTYFRFGGGKLGLMGEAGPEAVMPLSDHGKGMTVSAYAEGGSVAHLALTRGPDGKLGVKLPENKYAYGDTFHHALSNAFSIGDAFHAAARLTQTTNAFAAGDTFVSAMNSAHAFAAGDTFTSASNHARTFAAGDRFQPSSVAHVFASGDAFHSTSSAIEHDARRYAAGDTFGHSRFSEGDSFSSFAAGDWFGDNNSWSGDQTWNRNTPQPIFASATAPEQRGTGTRNETNVENNYNHTWNIQTPDVSGFRKSQRQIAQSMNRAAKGG